MATARVRKAYEALGVNLKSATGTIIVPAQTGKFFIPREAFAKIATRSGSGTLPDISILKVGGGVGDVLVDTTGGFASGILAGQLVEIALDGTATLQAVDIGSVGISVVVDVASTYTTHTADFYLEGYIL
jgi:hypothetical protein